MSVFDSELVFGEEHFGERDFLLEVWKYVYFQKLGSLEGLDAVLVYQLVLLHFVVFQAQFVQTVTISQMEQLFRVRYQIVREIKRLQLLAEAKRF